MSAAGNPNLTKWKHKWTLPRGLRYVVAMTRRLSALLGGIVALVMVATTALAAPPTAASVDAPYDSMVAGRERVPTVTVEQLDEDMVLVDVRPEEERQVSMLPGAVPLQAFEADPKAFAGKKVVFYCTLGVRSHTTTETWAERGYDVANFKGSALAWTHAGKPLVTPDGEATTRLHTWSRAFALQAKGYQAVY